MRAVWRYLLLASFVFWIGGFTFYISVVVPIGTDELESATKQGFITRRVTVVINRAAAVALVLLLVDLFLKFSRWRLGMWVVMAACQAALFRLHGVLDGMMDLERQRVTDEDAFRPWHRLYLWLHTVQWLAALARLWLFANERSTTDKDAATSQLEERG